MIGEILVADTACFNSTGVRLSSLNKINFIYGANGSGKTTVSNFLANPSIFQFNNCSMKWAREAHRVLVYNKGFREENFGSGPIKGVFTLGKATKEEIEDIEKKKIALKTIEANGIQAAETIKKQQAAKVREEERFRDAAWLSVYKENENRFKLAFKGFLKKEPFCSKLLTEFKSSKASLEPEGTLIEKYETIFGKTPKLIAPFLKPDISQLSQIENHSIWKKKIIGRTDIDISALITRLNINDWVNQGRRYIEAGPTCPFCQQETIDETFRVKLNGYFDQTYADDVSILEQQFTLYTTVVETLLPRLQEIVQQARLDPKLNLDSESFSAHVDGLVGRISANRELSLSKNKEPSRPVELLSTSEQVAAVMELLDAANQKIQAHNLLVQNYETEKAILVAQIWKYVATHYQSEILAHQKLMSGLEMGIAAITESHEALKDQYRNLRSEIVKLTDNVTSIQPTINRINGLLDKFGFSNFSIVPSKVAANHYELRRENGDLADSSLSEGEITFITFLYFLQLAEGGLTKDEIQDKRVLVVDDPISSLDSTILFVVSTLLKRHIENIKKDIGAISQLIVMTHNVYFHKEVSFVNGREHQNKHTHYWILRKNRGVSSVQEFGRENPISTSYELLWRELRTRAESSNISTQNVMRRIIENYFKILGRYGDDKLLSDCPTSLPKRSRRYAAP